MKITIPELSLVVLIGPSGSGKSTFARRHFKPTEVLSSDFFRGLVRDSETDQEATKDAFEVLHLALAKRLAARRLTVVDATNVQGDARKPLTELARKYHYLMTAIVFDLPAAVCHARNQLRPDRAFGPHVVRNQLQQLRLSLRHLEREGFRGVHVLSSAGEVESVVVERTPLWTDRRHDHGPFDFIGDVHGCYDELVVLLERLGYEAGAGQGGWRHPHGRKAVFVGDLVDRGPRVPDVLRLVMYMVETGQALCVMGNHDNKLLRTLRGNKVKVTHGLEASLTQLAPEPDEFRGRVAAFLDRLLSHYLLDGGKVVVAHAGLPEDLQGRASGRVRSFALFGDPTGESDEHGLPVRRDWAAEYRGRALVVYGHTPVDEARWVNQTMNIDTGCVFGGKLTALRYPEKELVQVAALRTYCEPARPLIASAAAGPRDDVLDLADVSGTLRVETRLAGVVTVREDNARAALEAMSRFAVDPRWLVYLPPTMSPCETSRLPGLLEHPAEAFDYFRKAGVERLVLEEKHMGSRAVVVVCRSAEAALRRFGIADTAAGSCYTRTGRRFFVDRAEEEAVLHGVRSALEGAGTWERLNTDWAVLDCEMMPWSAKAKQLLQQQYAAVAAASRPALTEAVALLERAPAPEAGALIERYGRQRESAEAFTASYRRYCWPVRSIADYRLAPFHLLATEGAVHTDKNHVWHMEELAALCRAGSGLLTATPYRVVQLGDTASEAEGVAWWELQTARGGEGMVVKPLDFLSPSSGRDRVQPAVKCRGREYLRIIYGLDYDAPEHIDRLRQRGLGHKRSLALREFALGIEALERFVRNESLRRVHECVFGVLALESEPVDPRL